MIEKLIVLLSPLAKLVGWITDFISTNLSVLVIVFLTILGCLLPYAVYRKFWWLTLCSIVAAILLFQLAATQIAQGWLLLPSWYRKIPIDSSPATAEEADLAKFRMVAGRLCNLNFSSDEFFALETKDLLADANTSLNQLLAALKLGSVRDVLSVKDFPEPFFSMGLAYGGPAYHDPLTREVVVPDPSRYPAGKVWHIHCLYHEVAHAKGFLNERDTTLLQLAAMTRSIIPTVRSLGWYRILKLVDSKGEELIPEEIVLDVKMGQEATRELVNNSVLVNLIKGQMRRLDLQNDPKKYGYTPGPATENPLVLQLLGLFNHKLIGYSE